MFSCVFKHLYSFQTFFGTKGTQPAEQAKIKEIRLLAQEQRNMFSEEVSFHPKFITHSVQSYTGEPIQFLLDVISKEGDSIVCTNLWLIGLCPKKRSI